MSDGNTPGHSVTRDLGGTLGTDGSRRWSLERWTLGLEDTACLWSAHCTFFRGLCCANSGNCAFWSTRSRGKDGEPGGCTCPKNEAPAPRQEATVSSTPAQHVGTDTGLTLCILKPRAACRGGRGMDTVYPGAMGSQSRRQRHLCAQMLSLS